MQAEADAQVSAQVTSPVASRLTQSWPEGQGRVSLHGAQSHALKPVPVLVQRCTPVRPPPQAHATCSPGAQPVPSDVLGPHAASTNSPRNTMNFPMVILLAGCESSQRARRL